MMSIKQTLLVGFLFHEMINRKLEWISCKWRHFQMIDVVKAGNDACIYINGIPETKKIAK